MAIVNELVTILSYKSGAGSAAALKAFSDGVDKVKKSFAAASAALVTFQAAVTAATFAASNRALSLEKMAQATGLGVEQLQKYEYAAESVGASSQAVTNDLQNLYKTMSSPIPGELNQTLLMLGINVRDAGNNMRSVNDIFADLSDTFVNMGQQEAIQWASKLGISKDTLILLRQGKAGIHDLMLEADALGAVIPEEAIAQGASFRKQLNSLTFALKGLGSQILLTAAPALERLIGGFKSFIIANKEFIRLSLGDIVNGMSDGFSKFGDSLKKVWSAITALIKPLTDIVTPMDKFQAASGLTRGVLASLLLLFAPFIAKTVAIGAAIGAVALIVDDFIGYLNGEDSAIGKIIESIQKWIDKHPLIKEAVQGVKDMFNDLLNVAKSVYSWFLDNKIKIGFYLDEAAQAVLSAIEWLYNVGKNGGENVAEFAIGFAKNNKSMGDYVDLVAKGAGYIANPGSIFVPDLYKTDIPKSEINNLSTATTNNNINNSRNTINISGLNQSELARVQQNTGAPTSQLMNPGGFGAIHQ